MTNRLQTSAPAVRPRMWDGSVRCRMRSRMRAHLWCGPGQHGRRRFAPLLLHFPVLLNHALPLLGTHLLPLAFQGTPLFFGSLAKLLVLLAHVLLLLGGQALELPPAFAQLLSLFGRHRTPLTEALLRARALLRRH